ncbi:uncharacterized protein LOC110901825 [Helianthus annuus]|uniref:uncharacterized protein LOC110901825 n=1 Tax=Helianthus annuus TaxID=4232 RepID=UPI000B8FA9D7|nr:uncharacterized protein LOC110901825 [Helianthus annuus]
MDEFMNPFSDMFAFMGKTGDDTSNNTNENVSNPSTKKTLSDALSVESAYGTYNKPPKLMAIEEYNRWAKIFEEWLKAFAYPSWKSLKNGYNIGRLDYEHLEGTESVESFVAEQKCIALLHQSVRDDIISLIEYTNVKDLWEKLRVKCVGSAEIVKNKKKLLRKEFDLFSCLKNESVSKMIERFWHLKMELARHGIIYSQEELVDKLFDLLPNEQDWQYFALMLKNTIKSEDLTVDLLIERLESHELEIKKSSKINNSSYQENVELYYRGSMIPKTVSPKTALSAESSNTVNQEAPSSGYHTGSSSTSQGQSVPKNMFQCNIAVDLKNAQNFSEESAKQQMVFLASVVESYESLVADSVSIETVIQEIADYEEGNQRMWWGGAEEKEKEKELQTKKVDDGIIDTSQEFTAENLKKMADKVLTAKELEVVSGSGNGSKSKVSQNDAISESGKKAKTKSDYKNCMKNCKVCSTLAYLNGEKTVELAKRVRDVEDQILNRDKMLKASNERLKELTEKIEKDKNGELLRSVSRWIMDSGASQHMPGKKTLLYDVRGFNGGYVGFAGNQGGRIVGEGTLSNGIVTFERVNYIAELENNLLSISQICDRIFSWVSFPKYKDETIESLMALFRKIENLYQTRIRRIRSDNGTELKNNKMEEYCDEREAVSAACYTLNRVLTVKKFNKTCFELINNRKPNLKYLKSIGSPCTVLEPFGKFGLKSIDGIFVGYSSPLRRVFVPSLKQIIEASNVECQGYTMPP